MSSPRVVPPPVKAAPVPSRWAQAAPAVAAVCVHHHHHHYHYGPVPMASPVTSHVPRSLSHKGFLVLPPQRQSRPGKMDIYRLQQMHWKHFLRELYSEPSAKPDAQPSSSASGVSRVDQLPSDSACQPDKDSFKEDYYRAPSAETDAQSPSSASRVSRVEQPPSDSACQPDEDSFKEDYYNSAPSAETDAQSPSSASRVSRVDQPPSDSACQPDEDSFKPANNSSDMESDSDFVSVENKEHQWGKLMEEWENEKKRKMKELAWSERACREPEESESDENEDDENFHGESHEDLIERTRDVLQRHGGEGSSGHRTHATADGKTELLKVDVETLRYSQFTCAPYFQCGKSVSQLVNELLDGKVTTSAPLFGVDHI